MEKQIIKKVLAILMIITLMSADFFVLGSNLISYAAESNNLTNNKNIEFSTYFKDSKGEKVEKLETSIKTEDLKLYAETSGRASILSPISAISCGVISSSKRTVTATPSSASFTIEFRLVTIE